MRKTWEIFKRDLKSYYSSPIAYVVIALFIAVSGVFFYALLTRFLNIQMQAMYQAQQMGRSITVNVNQMMIRPLLANMSIIALFMIPMITMRSFSEDKRSGTIELLLTSPISNTQMILGKFGAAFVLYASMVVVAFIYPVVLMFYGNPEIAPTLMGYLGLLLMGAATVSVGVLISSFTENQIIAAIGTFAVMMLFWTIGWLGTGNSFFADLASYLSIIEHMGDFTKGVFDTKHLVYYASFLFVALFLTYQSIESTKWRG
ncbi:MAG: ABC transporter permease subunit [Candidatus Marinimicrobia bacterium]|nr:ABC transporter permease subunit [Candidatus Neomarinimicrobiota bacterium]MCF7828960.1 ABC transporter permease subunit [Candidatus Neomarinimicrobiota bacterium]MCF7879920.1 ABC transporter permease subunit [Candidatus Neomarinimicrobiota bacterium]